MESSSSYPALAVPVISSKATSTVTSMRSSGTMDAFPPYAGLSGPDLPTPRRALETPTLEGPGSLDSLLAYDISILENVADLT